MQILETPVQSQVDAHPKNECVGLSQEEVYKWLTSSLRECRHLDNFVRNLLPSLRPDLLCCLHLYVGSLPAGPFYKSPGDGRK